MPLWLGRRVLIFLLGKVVEHYLGDYTKSLKKVAFGAILLLLGSIGGTIAALAGLVTFGYTAGGIGAIAGLAIMVIGAFLVTRGVLTILRTIRGHVKRLGGLLGPVLNRHRPAITQ
jgi:hypothetical protein